MKLSTRYDDTDDEPISLGGGFGINRSLLDIARAERVKGILEQGELHLLSADLSYQLGNEYKFHYDLGLGASHVLVGQSLGKVKDHNIRLYNHMGVYAGPGMGKGEFLNKTILKSGLFPSDHPAIPIGAPDTSTAAALIGSFHKSRIKLGSISKYRILLIEELAALFSGEHGREMQGIVSKLQESGVVSKDLIKFGDIADIFRKERLAVKMVNFYGSEDKEASVEKNKTEGMIEKARKSNLSKVRVEQCVSDMVEAQDLREELVRVKKFGFIYHEDTEDITINAPCSWIVASARYAAATPLERPLVLLGQANRYDWFSFTPSLEERRGTVRNVGLAILRGKMPSKQDVHDCYSAWWHFITVLKRKTEEFELPMGDNTFYVAQKHWDNILDSVEKRYPQNPVTHELRSEHLHQFDSLRTTGALIRTAIQHAALLQFKRAREAGRDYETESPNVFRFEAEEDFEYAESYFTDIIIPGLIVVINDIQNFMRGSSQGDTEKRRHALRHSVLSLLPQDGSKVPLKDLIQKINTLTSITSDTQARRLIIEMENMELVGTVRGKETRSRGGQVWITERGQRESKNESDSIQDKSGIETRSGTLF